MAAKRTPEGYSTVTPHLILEGAEQCLVFVKQAFGAQERVRTPGPNGTFGLAEVQIGDSVVTISDGGEQTAPMPACLHLYVEDCDAVYRRALDAGGTSIREPAQPIQGDRLASVRDMTGNQWWISTHVEEAQRLGPKLIKLIPAPLQPLLARIHRPLARYLAAGKYRRKYGAPFVSTIAEEDDLLQWELARIETHIAAFRYHHAVKRYLLGGEWNAHDVERELAEVGFSLREAGSFLEFACGYGRMTRHLVHKISPSKITVSDIDRQAVDFVTKQVGVRGFYSTTTAEALTHDDRYDAIAVVSLFTHLSIEDWGPWLKRLIKMLNPDGLLMISTNNVNDADEKLIQAKADGFLYTEENETRGRLSVEHYGAAYVSEEYVERVVADDSGGRLLKFCPHAVMINQDAYILQRVD